VDQLLAAVVAISLGRLQGQGIGFTDVVGQYSVSTGICRSVCICYSLLLVFCRYVLGYGGVVPALGGMGDLGVAGLGGSRAGCNDMDSLRPSDDCEGTRKSFSRFCKCVYSIT
jgi:hypothetical protein